MPQSVDEIRAFDRGRNRRKFALRGRVVPISKRAIAEESKRYPEQPGIDYARPLTRGDCAGGERPCPFVSCRHHLFLEVLPSGNIKFNFPGLEPTDLNRTCSLDVAEQEALTEEEIAAVINLSRMGLLLVESEALAKLKRTHGDFLKLLFEQISDEPPRRRLPIARER